MCLSEWVLSFSLNFVFMKHNLRTSALFPANLKKYPYSTITTKDLSQLSKHYCFMGSEFENQQGENLTLGYFPKPATNSPVLQTPSWCSTSDFNSDTNFPELVQTSQPHGSARQDRPHFATSRWVMNELVCIQLRGYCGPLCLARDSRAQACCLKVTSTVCAWVL